MERLGVNAVFNSGAIKLDGKFCLVARVEGSDRKFFFTVAESDSGVDGFRFRDYPVVLPDTCPEETNVYDMRLTKHEDGWIYGLFCSERKDTASDDLSAAVAAAGIVRAKNLKTWERLPDLVTLRSLSSGTCVCCRSSWTENTPFSPGQWTTSSRPAPAAASASACAGTSPTPSLTGRSSPAPGGITPSPRARTAPVRCPSEQKRAGSISPTASAIPPPACAMWSTPMPPT